MYMCPRCGFYTLVEVENEEHLKCEVCDLRIYADGKSTDTTGVDFTERYYRAIKVGDTLVYKDMPYVMRGVPVHYSPVLAEGGTMSSNLLEMSAKLHMLNVKRSSQNLVDDAKYAYSDYMKCRKVDKASDDKTELLSLVYEEKLTHKISEYVDVLIRNEDSTLSHTTAYAIRISPDDKYVNVISYKGILVTLPKVDLKRIIPGTVKLTALVGSCMKGDHDVN